MAKKKKKIRKKPQAYKHYKNGKTKTPNCPKCGEGTFLAEHKDRWYCGKCGYTKWKKSEQKTETKPTKTESSAKPKTESSAKGEKK